MNFLDIIIVLVVLLQAVRWAGYGLIRGVLSIGGFWAGIFLGAMLVPQTLNMFAQEPLGRLLVAMATVIGAGLLLGFIGQLIGGRLFHLADKLRLRKLDSALGAATGVVATLLVFWLVAAILGGTPFQNLNQQLRGSAILQTMNQQLPPAPAVISRITDLVDPSEFPEVFTGLEPRPIEPVDPPTEGELQAALAAAGQSTVRIESAGCGGLVNGSGFVIDDNLVMTNAHVVAGIERPTIVDASGQQRARTVVFDPELDIAILRVENVAGPPLELAANLAKRGATGAVLGYPGGGRLTVEEAAVLRQLEARGRDIYGRELVTRPVYELQADVRSGNSGGPVVRADGTVLGIVFARSHGSNEAGYAITSPAVSEHIAQAQARSASVDTGQCVPR